jgi:streptomycin 6-kinase
MQDEELTQTLALVAKLISKPDVPASVGVELIVKLQAYSAKFAMLASWYTNVKKDERAKKNIYYSAKEATDRLVDALKYAVRINNG